MPIPPVLLEGDTSPPEPAGGPGQRYALGPVPPPEHGETDAVRGDLPESYGTGRLFVTARDPHWLYAWWDLSREQQSRCNALAANHHLTLRVFKDNAEGDPLDQIPVHPESRFWFAPVPHAGSRYVVELGYFMPSDRWVRVAVSRPTLTPADTLSGDAGAEFVTIPQDVPFAQLMVLVKEAARDQTPLARALGELRDSGHPGLPADQVPHAGHWSAEQEHALAEVLSMDAVRRVWLGSLEITELVRRQLARELSSAALAQAVSPAGAVSSISSPMGGAPGRRGFWFNVNAELVLYGATEPNAAVTIADRPIKLRPDGTFSFRFALPDGAYQLDARAVSADGADARVAGLKFTRATSHRGGVDAHAQDPALKPPGADAVA